MQQALGISQSQTTHLNMNETSILFIYISYIIIIWNLVLL